MMHGEYKKHAVYGGPGGRRCPCCGPSPRERPKFDRTQKRRLKFQMRRETEREIVAMHEEQA